MTNQPVRSDHRERQWMTPKPPMKWSYTIIYLRWKRNSPICLQRSYRDSLRESALCRMACLGWDDFLETTYQCYHQFLYSCFVCSDVLLIARLRCAVCNEESREENHEGLWSGHHWREVVCTLPDHQRDHQLQRSYPAHVSAVLLDTMLSYWLVLGGGGGGGWGWSARTINPLASVARHSSQSRRKKQTSKPSYAGYKSISVSVTHNKLKLLCLLMKLWLLVRSIMTSHDIKILPSWIFHDIDQEKGIDHFPNPNFCLIHSFVWLNAMFLLNQ